VAHGSVGPRDSGGPYTEVVSNVEQLDEPTVRVYPPEEALKRARPLPPRDRLVIEDVPDEEWAAFQEALADE
jgi:hypothetical protein